MSEKHYCKFQYSIFLRDSRDEQLVIRTDTFEELIEAKKDIDKIITKREKVSMSNEDHPELEEEGEKVEGKWCTEHSAAMIRAFSKTKRDAQNNPKAYWYHREGKQMCFGSGFK